MGEAPNMPTEITYFKDWIPNPVRFVFSIIFVLGFQISSGVYISSASEMVGSTSLLREDFVMAGMASFVGMTLVFPALFRMKFRFTTRNMLLSFCPVIIICNIITMTTHCVPILVLFSFIAGTVRMWASFECFSNLQLTLTKTRDMTIFFPFIHLIIVGNIALNGTLAAHISWWSDWKYMHLFVIGYLLVVWFLVAILTKQYREGPVVPLKGLDFWGWGIWVIFLMSTVFVFTYGEHYDWFYSPWIRLGTFIAVVSLLVGGWRMFHIKSPFISPRALNTKDVKFLMFMYFLLCLFLATPSILQSMYTGNILDFDRLNDAALNWWGFGGVAFGCLLCYIWLHILDCRIRVLVLLGFGAVVLYQVLMYFYLDPGMNKEYLFVPTFIRYAGFVIVYIALTTYAYRLSTFEFFFMEMSLFGFVRTGFGDPMADAIVTRAMNTIVPRNFAMITSQMDAVAPNIAHAPVQTLYGDAMQQAMLASMKEVFGWCAVGGVVMLILMLAYRDPGPFTTVKRYFGRFALRDAPAPERSPKRCEE